MSGILRFELKQWQPAKELLSRAKVIYEKLASALSGDAVATYNQRVADIEPSIRFVNALSIVELNDAAVTLLPSHLL